VPTSDSRGSVRRKSLDLSQPCSNGLPILQTYLLWICYHCNPSDLPSSALAALSILPIDYDDEGRLGALVQLVRLFADDADSAMDSGGSDELRKYGTSLGPGIVAVVMALLVLLCWPLLWVSRCCAHRCCRHSARPYSTRARRRAAACCVLMGSLVLVFVLIGILAGAVSP
jgi:hypothetical protein